MATQAVVARSVAMDGAWDSRTVLGAGVVLGGGMLLLAPPLTALLQLESTITMLPVAAAVAALTATAGPVGVIQGREQFPLLAMLLVGQGVLRVLGGVAGLLLVGSVTAAMTGVAAGLLGAAVVAWVVAPTRSRMRRGQIRQIGGAAAMLLGFILLSNADVVLARIVLDPAVSGTYGVGSILTKVAFWLPQFASVMAYARLSQPDRRETALRLALASVVVSGVLTTGATALLAQGFVTVVAGDQYLPAAPLLWRFALLGALLATAQVSVYGALARRDRVTTALVWLALVALLLLALPAETVGHVVTAACIVAAVLMLVTGARELAHAKGWSSEGDPVAVPESIHRQ
jgi:O-antigen/teichoic acid export membrane protein